jgi:hypothetical protein
MTNIFRQHTLTKEGGCKRAQPRLRAILPLGGLVHAEVVVFVRQGRSTIKPYDPVTTERAEISAAQ